jgi:hypothetical protein
LVLPNMGWLSPSKLTWAGIVLMGVALAGLIWKADDLHQFLSHSRKILIGIVILSLIVSAFSFVVLVLSEWNNLLPVSMWQSRVLPPENIKPEIGNAYFTCDSKESLSSDKHPSSAQLLENGVELGPGNSLHADIRSEGNGRFSFWHKCIYFSASDNTNPAENGRIYSIQAPPLESTYETLWLVFLMMITYTTLSVLLFRRARWIGDQVSAVISAPLAVLQRVPFLKTCMAGIASAVRYISFSTSWLGYLLRTVTFALPFLVYAAFLIIKIPGKVGLEARIGTGATLPLFLALLLYLVFQRNDWIGDLVGLTLVLLFFSLPLSGLWNSGYSNGSIIGGLLPWSDASDYYGEANYLLEGGMLGGISQRRPLFPGTLAAVLGLVHGNLAVALAIFGAVAVLACFLLACEVRRSHGTIAGIVTLVILFLFYRTYIGLSLTENLGLALGAFALAVLWRGAGSSKKKIVWAGIFLLTLALCARAGAFLILPMLVLWGAWYFRGKSCVSLRFFFVGCAAILLGFLLDAIVRRLVANSGGTAFGNFANVLYGLAMGNQIWSQVYIDHPFLSSLSVSEQSTAIYQLAFEAFRSDPTRAVEGLLGAWRDYLNPTCGAFSFVNLNLFGILDIPGTRWALFAVSGFGLLGCIRRVRDPQASLVLVSTVGILASVPFAPPIDSDSMRAYAATIPFAAIWVALGLFTMSKGLKGTSEMHLPFDERPMLSPVILGLALALFCFLSPILIKWLSRPTQFVRAECPSGLVTIYIRSDRSAAVNLISDNTSPSVHLLDIRVSDFKDQLHLSTYPELTNELNNMTAGQTLILGLDMGISGDSRVWLIANTSSLPSSAGIFRVCAHPVKNWLLQQYLFYEVDTVEQIQSLADEK